MKTCERLDYCPHILIITLVFPRSGPTFPNSVSISKIGTSGDLHSTIKGHASHHLRTCIITSKALHQNIRTGSASSHPRTCITPSRPASGHPYSWWNFPFWLHPLFEIGSQLFQAVSVLLLLCCYMRLMCCWSMLEYFSMSLVCRLCILCSVLNRAFSLEI